MKVEVKYRAPDGQADLLVPPAPEPPPGELPFRRLFTAYKRNILQTWPARAYQDGVLSRSSFGRTWLLFNTPTAIRRVLIDNPDNYGRTPASIRILRPFTGRGLLLSEGPAWRHQRRTLAPAFAPRTLDLLARVVAETCDEAIEALARGPDGTVDLLAAMQHLALEVAGRSMFSLEMTRYCQAMRTLITEYGRGLGRPRLLDLWLTVWLPSPHDLARFAFRRRWIRLIETIIAERGDQRPAAEARDLFDLMLAARDPETGRAFTPRELRDQVATMIIAGHETTGLTLFWSLYLLALDPANQERLADEVAEIDLSPDGAAANLERLVFARAVVQEALRLYPPAFAIVRAAKGPDTVDGLEVAPGSVIFIAPWVLHRHRGLWHAPDAFDPARFLPDAPPVDRFAYLPFGAGPRVCIGAQFALTEATLVLARLIQRFRIELEDQDPVLPVAVVTTQPSRSPTFRLTARNAPSG